MKSWPCRALRATAIAAASWLCMQSAMGGADWPMWRFDAARTGVSPEALPGDLSLLWMRELQPPRPAWSDARLAFDAAPQPVMAGKTIVLGSSSEDFVAALNTEDGSERWRFFTDGPVRLPPAIGDHRVYAVSDDGCLYCLDLEDGHLLWKFNGAPTAQKLLGNGRLVSMWPARGGPVIHEGKVYFGAGIWPFMGIFIHALDAVTGKPVWENDGAGAAFGSEPGATASTFGSVSPQGAFAVSGGRLVVPSGRAWPAYFDLKSGQMAPHSAGIKDIAGGGDSQISVNGDLLFMGGYIASIQNRRALVFNAPAATIAPFLALPVFDDDRLWVSEKGGIAVHDLTSANFKKLSGAYGRPIMRCDTRVLGKLAVPAAVEVMIKAGPDLYAAGKGWVGCARSVSGSGAPELVWQNKFEGRAGGLVAADDRLFVSTREGRLYCFGATPGHVAKTEHFTAAAPQASDDAGRRVERLIQECGVTEGHAVLAGIDDLGFVLDLVRRTQLHVIVLRQERAVVDRWRDQLAAAGLYGDRVVVIPAEPASLPAYLATLIACGDPSMDAGALFERLRPYGGVLCFLSKPGHHIEIPGATQKTSGDWTLLVRSGGLPGAADWTHDAADAGNTWMGPDARVKAPLGVLWFGGAAGDPSLFMQRHTDPPGGRVCQGRMFIHGDNQITAVDAYTGRVLWNRRLPDVRAYQNLRSNVQAGPPYEKMGETTQRANFVAHPDALYLAYGQSIYVWDSATGKSRAEFRVPAEGENGNEALYLGDLRLQDDVLVVGADFATNDIEAVFVAEDFRDVSPEKMVEMARQLEAWATAERPARRETDSDTDHLVQLSNRLLHDTNLVARIPADLRQLAAQDKGIGEAARSAIAGIERQSAVQRRIHAPYLMIEHGNRRLIEAYFPTLRKIPPKIHWSNLYPWDGTATRQLVGISRIEGRILWRQNARYGFPQKSIAVGRNRVFCLDRVDPDIEDVLRRRGISRPSQPRLLAFSLHDGKPAWTSAEEISGYELFYSAAHDIVVQASAHDPAPEQWWSKPRDLSVTFVAYAGEDGRRLWDRQFTLNRPGGGHRLWHNWLLHDDTILLESYRDRDAEFHAFDLRTGATKTRTSALTGVERPWTFHRMGGCTKNVCSPNLVLFRSNAAGYYDIAGDGGTASLGGFRPGCKNSLIPAAGLLNAPNYASGCTCNYAIFTSLALMHMPGLEQWSCNDYSYDGHPVKRVGLNLGAPGDRLAPDGTLWLDVPSVGGASPDIPVTIGPSDVRWHYRHSSIIRGGAPGWIVASCGEGIESVSVPLRGDANPEPRSFKVRLYFAERENVAAGERVFDVLLQGREVAKHLDIVAEAGGPNVGLIKEWAGIKVSDALNLRLIPVHGKTLLCGIELLAEENR